MFYKREKYFEYFEYKKTAKEWYKQSAKIVILTRHTFQSSKVNFEYYCWT